MFRLNYFFELGRHGADVPEGGIGMFSAHGFRRTSISNQLGEGINGASVSLTSGHRSAEGLQSYASSTNSSRLNSTAAAFGISAQPDVPQERPVKRIRIDSSSSSVSLSSSSSASSPSSSTTTSSVGFPPAYPFQFLLPPTSATQTPEDIFKARVKKLKRLLKKNMITEQEFGEGRRKAYKETLGR